MNGGFCHLPFDNCVQRQMHHCGRSISGANARDSFVRSFWYVVGFLSGFSMTAPKKDRWRAACRNQLATVFPAKLSSELKRNLVIKFVGKALCRRRLDVVVEFVVLNRRFGGNGLTVAGSLRRLG